MKKNVMMRVASLLMVCVLATTCGISGTFAKYVTSGSSNDSARVAKFGVEVEANFSGLFAQGYKVDDSTAANESEATVWTNVKTDGVNFDNLVAPGTAGELADFTVTGTPEVDVRVTYDATLTLTGWFLDANENGVKDAGEEEYCPIVFTVNSTEYSMDGYTSVATFAAAVEAAIEDADEEYQTNTDLSGATVADDLAVSWKWHYEGKGDHAVASGPYCQTDAKDTVMGDAAAAGFAATIELDITCTVTQID